MTSHTSSATTKIHLDHPKLFLLAAFVFALDLLLIWALITGNVPRLPADLFFPLGWFAVIGVSLLLAVSTPQLLDRRPALELSDAGMVAPAISPEVIPWGKIVDVKIVRRGRHDAIEVQIDADFVKATRLNPLHRLAGGKLENAGVTSYFLALHHLQQGAPYIMARIAEYYQSWMARSPRY